MVNSTPAKHCVGKAGTPGLEQNTGQPDRPVWHGSLLSSISARINSAPHPSTQGAHRVPKVRARAEHRHGTYNRKNQRCYKYRAIVNRCRGIKPATADIDCTAMTHWQGQGGCLHPEPLLLQASDKGGPAIACGPA